MLKYATPLRYPGGKQRLANFFTELLVENNLLGGHFAELYCGGAGAAIDLLLTNKVSHIHLNDSSYAVFAFWKSILEEPERFCRQIATTPLNVDTWKLQREICQHLYSYSTFDVGFAFFYLNRCNRSGVISGGVIGGISQEGTWKMDARFSRNELIRRIESIALKSSFITVQNLDAEQYITDYIPTLPQKVLIYCDPPYYEKSSGLYLNWYKKSDHERLSEKIQNNINRPWVLSYDAAPNILQYYRQRQQFIYSLQYNAAKAYKGQEVLIISDELKFQKSSSLPYIQEALSTYN